MKRIIVAFALMTAAFGLTLNAAETKPMLSEKEAKTLVATAKTPADHLKLAGYYMQMSDNFLAEATNHEQMKAGYQTNSTYQSTKFKLGTLDHCDYFIKSSRESAQKMKELAAIHEEMAKAGAKK
jgi:hypothetical protein